MVAAGQNTNSTEKKIAFGIEDSDELLKFFDESKKKLKDLSEKILTPLQKTFKSYSESFTKQNKQIKAVNKSVEISSKQLKAYEKSVKNVTKELSNLSKLSGKINLGKILWGGFNAYSNVSIFMAEFTKIAKTFAEDITNVWSRTDKVLNRMANSGYDVSIARLKDEMLGFFTLNPAIVEEFTNKSLVAFDQFEASLNQFNTIFGASKSVLKEYGNELQKTVDGPLKNLTSSIDSLAISYQVASGEFSDMKENLSILESIEKLSVGASSPDKFGVGGLIIKSLRSFDKGGEEAGDVAAKLLKMEQLGLTSVKEAQDILPQAFTSAKAAGLEFEDVLASVDTLTTSGMPTAPSVTALNSFINSVLSMGPEQKKILRELGVTFDDLSNFGPKLQQLSKALGGNIEKLRELFPEMNAFKAAIALTNDEANSFVDNLEQINATTTGTLDEAFENIAQSTEKKFQAIQNSYNELLISFGKAFSEQQNKYLERYEESAFSIRNIILENKDLVIELAKNLAIVVEKIGKVTGTIVAIGKALFSTFTTILSFKAFTVVFNSISNKFFGTTNAGILDQTKLIKSLIKEKHGWLKVLGHLVGVNQEHRRVLTSVNQTLLKQKGIVTDINLGIVQTAKLSKDAQKELDAAVKGTFTHTQILQRTGMTKATEKYNKQKGRVIAVAKDIGASSNRSADLNERLARSKDQLANDANLTSAQRKEMRSQQNLTQIQLEKERKLREMLRIQRDIEIKQLKELGAIKKGVSAKVDTQVNNIKQVYLNLSAAQIKQDFEQAQLIRLQNTQKALSIQLDKAKLEVNKNEWNIQRLTNQLTQVNTELEAQQNVVKQTSLNLSRAKKIAIQEEGLAQGKLTKIMVFGNEVIVRNNIIHKTNAKIMGFVKNQIDATTASLIKKFPWLLKVGKGFTFLSTKAQTAQTKISLFTKSILTKFPFIAKAVDFLKIKFGGLSGAIKGAGLAVAGLMSTIASMAVLTVVMGLIMKIGSLISKNNELKETYKELSKDVKDHVSNMDNLGLAYNRSEKTLLKLSDRLVDADKKLKNFNKEVVTYGDVGNSLTKMLGIKDWQARLSGYSKRAEVFADLEDSLHRGNLQIIKQNKLMREGVPLSEITNEKIKEKILLTAEDFNREEKIHKQRIKFVENSIAVQEQRVQILEDKGKKMTDLEKAELDMTRAKIQTLEELKRVSIETYKEQEKYLKVRNQYLDTLKDTQNEVISVNELDNTKNSLQNLNYELNNEIQSSFSLYQNKIVNNSTDFIKSVNDGSIVLKQTLTDLKTDLVSVNEEGQETLKINQEAFNTLTKALSGEQIDGQKIKIAELLASIDEYKPLLNSLGAKNREDVERIAANLEELYLKNSNVLKNINTDTFKSIITSVQVMEDRYKETRRKFLNTNEDNLGVTSFITSLNTESDKLEAQLDNTLSKISAVIEGQTSYVDTEVKNLVDGLLNGRIKVTRESLAQEFKQLGIAISDIPTEKLDKIYESINGENKEELISNLKDIGVELVKTFSFEEIDPQKFNSQINSYLNNIRELNAAGEITSKEAVQRLSIFTEEIKQYIEPEVYKALQEQVLNIQKNIGQEETLLNKLRIEKYESLFNQKLLLEQTYAKQTFDLQELVTKKFIEVKEAEIETLKKSYSEESVYVQKAEQELINLRLKLQIQEQDRVTKLRQILIDREKKDLQDNLESGIVTRQTYLDNISRLETKYYVNLIREKKETLASLDKEDELYKEKYAAIVQAIKDLEIEKNRTILELNKKRIEEQVRLKNSALQKQLIQSQQAMLDGSDSSELDKEFKLQEKKLEIARQGLLKELGLYRNNADKRKEIQLELLENTFEKQKLYRDKQIQNIERDKTKRIIELRKEQSELEIEINNGTTEELFKQRFEQNRRSLEIDKDTLEKRLVALQEGSDEYLELDAQLHKTRLDLAELAEKESLELSKFYMQKRVANFNLEQAELEKKYLKENLSENIYLQKSKELQNTILENDIEYQKIRLKTLKKGSIERLNLLKEIAEKESQLLNSDKRFEQEKLDREYRQKTNKIEIKEAELALERAKGNNLKLLAEEQNLANEKIKIQIQYLKAKLNLAVKDSEEYFNTQKEINFLETKLLKGHLEQKRRMTEAAKNERVQLINLEIAEVEKAYVKGIISYENYLNKISALRRSKIKEELAANKELSETFKKNSVEHIKLLQEREELETKSAKTIQDVKIQTLDREYRKKIYKVEIEEAALSLKRTKGSNLELLAEEQNLANEKIKIQIQYLKAKLKLTIKGSEEYLKTQKEINILETELLKNHLEQKRQTLEAAKDERVQLINLEIAEVEKAYIQDTISYENYLNKISALKQSKIKEELAANEKLSKTFKKGNVEHTKLLQEKERLETEFAKIVQDVKIQALEKQIKQEQLAFEKFKVTQEYKIQLLKLEIKQIRLLQQEKEIGFEYEQSLLSLERERLQLVIDRETDRVKKAEINTQLVQRQNEIQLKSLDIEDRKLENQKQSLELQKKSIIAEQQLQELQLNSQKISIELEIKKAEIFNKSKEDIELLEVQLKQIEQNLSLLDKESEIKNEQLILQERQIKNEQLIIQQRRELVGERGLLDLEIAKNREVIARLDKQISLEKLRQQSISISLQKYTDMNQVLDATLGLQDKLIASQQNSIDILTSGIANLFNLEKSLVKTEVRSRTLERQRLDGELKRLDIVQEIQDKQLKFELKRNELARQRQLIEKETELIRSEAAVRLAIIEEKKIQANRNSSEEDKEAARLTVEAAVQTLNSQKELYDVIQKQQALEANLDRQRVGQLDFQQDQERLQLEGEKAKFTKSSKDDARVRREANKLRDKSEDRLLKQLRELSDFSLKLPERKDITESLKKDLEVYSKSLSESNAEIVTKEIVTAIQSQTPILKNQTEILSKLIPEKVTENIENQTSAINRFSPENMTEGERKLVKNIENQTAIIERQATVVKENNSQFVDNITKQIYEKIDKAMASLNFNPDQLSEVERSFYDMRQTKLELESLDVWHRLGGFNRKDQIKKVWTKDEIAKKVQDDAKLAKERGLLDDMPSSYAEDQKKYDNRSYNLLKTNIPDIDEMRSLINKESKSTMSNETRKDSEKVIARQTHTLEEIRDLLKDKKENNITINSPITMTEEAKNIPNFNNQFYNVIEEVQKRL
jgi:hypothetical protein